MPRKSARKDSFAQNFRKEVSSGKSKEQAIVIAFRIKSREIRSKRNKLNRR